MTQPLASVDAAATTIARSSPHWRLVPAHGDGAACLRRRSSLVDTLVTGLWVIAGRCGPSDCTGGYGRLWTRELFPYFRHRSHVLCLDARVESRLAI